VAHRLALFDQPLDGVGDLELAALRRLDGAHRLVDRLVEEIHADEREVARRIFGFLDEALHVAVFRHFGDTELARVVDVAEKYLGGRGVLAAFGAGRLELAHETIEALLEHVVAEIHDEVVVTEEVVRDQHAVREAEWLILRNVRDLHAELRAIADRGANLFLGVANDDADFADAGLLHRLDAVEQDRLVGDGHQLFGAGVGDRPQPRAGAAGEDETFHRQLRLVEPE